MVGYKVDESFIFVNHGNLCKVIHRTDMGAILKEARFFGAPDSNTRPQSPFIVSLGEQELHHAALKATCFLVRLKLA